MLSSSRVLVHYNPELSIVVSSDASSCGIGSVLSHRLQDGSHKHIAFASQSLSDCEKKYAQLEKEALALIFGIAKFHKYLYGPEFLLQTDHMPLLGLLKEDRTILAMASARIQRWALTLSNYQYTLWNTNQVRVLVTLMLLAVCHYQMYQRKCQYQKKWCWRYQVPNDLDAYGRRKHELSVQHGVLF